MTTDSQPDSVDADSEPQPVRVDSEPEPIESRRVWETSRPSWPLEEIDAASHALGKLPPRVADDDGVTAAAEVVRLAGELGRQLGDSDAPFPSEAPEIHRVLGLFSAALRAIRTGVDQVDELGVVPSDISRDLSVGAGLLNDALTQFVDLLRDELRGEQRDKISPILDLFAARLRARQLVRETEGARDSARQAAGTTGETALASHFGQYAKREAQTANVLRGSCVAVLLAITAFAAVLLFRSTPKSSSTAVELAKLALTVPLGALAAYLAREASNHRAAAQWAAELEVQLLTIDAYMAPLPAELRNDIRVELGRRVFTSHAPGPARDQIEVTPTSIATATDLVQKVLELVRTSERRQTGDG